MAGCGRDNFCQYSIIFAFILPVAQLTLWAVDSFSDSLNQRYLEFVWHSLSLAIIATILTTFAAILLAYAARLHTGFLTRFAVRLATIGYALPGAVLAVGIFIPLAWLDSLLSDWLLVLFNFESGLLIQEH